MENIDESYKSMLMNYSNCCKIISHYEDSINQLYNNLDESDFANYKKGRMLIFDDVICASLFLD